jgi:antitoxin PrlF
MQVSAFDAKLTSKGQVTIPAEVRSVLGIGQGDRVEFFVHRDGRVIVRARNRPADAIVGSLAHRTADARPMSDDDAIAEAIVMRDKKSRDGSNN